MPRTCAMCKAENAQWENSCGYLPKDQRREDKIDFPALKSPNITVDKCPVYYFNKYRYLYDWYNKIELSRPDISNFSLSKRVVYTEMLNYFNIRREYFIEKERSKNGS